MILLDLVLYEVQRRFIVPYTESKVLQVARTTKDYLIVMKKIPDNGDIYFSMLFFTL